MKVFAIEDLKLDERHITKLPCGGGFLEVKVVDRGAQPRKGTNYLAVRAYSESVSGTSEKELYARTRTGEDDGFLQTFLEFCGRVVNVHKPEGLVDPYFQDLQMGYVITVQTPGFEFDLDGYEGDIPGKGDFLEGTADFFSILVRRDQLRDEPSEKASVLMQAVAETSPCTKITELMLKEEILENPEKFLSAVMQNKEAYIARIFSKGAGVIGCRTFREEEFTAEMFLRRETGSVCTVIGLPGAEAEFDYAVIGLELSKEDKNDPTFYMLERCEGDTYILRAEKKGGISWSAEMITEADSSLLSRRVRKYIEKNR